MKKQKDLPLWAQTGHRKPQTRREFLASGIIGFTSSVVLGNAFMNLLSSRAMAATGCGDSSGASSSLIPFVTVNLSGGMAMAANFVPMDAGGQPLPSYNKMGLGDGQLPIEREFGGVPFAGMNNGVLISRFLQGVRETGALAIPNTAFVGVCVRSRDDSDENRFDVSGMVAKAGLVGQFLPNLGTSQTRTGIQQQPAILAPPSPLVVGNYNDLAGSVTYVNGLATNLTVAERGKLARTMRRLNDAQTLSLMSEPSGEKVKQLVDCAGIKNESILSGGGINMDPRTDASLTTLWNLTANNTGQNIVFASSVYSGLMGYAGVVNLNMGGYDYHNGTRTTGDQKDLEAGQNVGRILETARILNKPVFVYVTSDGAVSSPESSDRAAPWTSDRGSAGAAYMLYFNPSGRSQTSGFSVGHYTVGQAADDKFITGNNPELAAAAVVANYLKINSRMDLFEEIAGRVMTATDLDKVVKF